MLFRRLIVPLAAMLAGIGSAAAQGYPSQTVTLVVPFSAGSLNDSLARVLADKLQGVWGKNVVVENRPGLPGTATVARSAPDGHTLMVTSNGHTIASTISKNLSFDPVKDFAGVTQIALAPLIMIVPPNLPVANVREFVELARAKPKELNFSSAGVATASFLSAEIFRQAADLTMTHVPYRGAPEAATAVMRGDAHMYFAPLSVAKELSVGGKVKALAVDSAKRVPQVPELLTLVEAGVPNFKFETWIGVMAPAGTPRAIIESVNGDIAKILKSQDVIDRFQAIGVVPVSTRPDEFDAIIKSDTERNGGILRAAGVGGH